MVEKVTVMVNLKQYHFYNRKLFILITGKINILFKIIIIFSYLDGKDESGYVNWRKLINRFLIN